MNKLKCWMDKPITRGDYFKFIGATSGISLLAMGLELAWLHDLRCWSKVLKERAKTKKENHIHYIDHNKEEDFEPV